MTQKELKQLWAIVAQLRSAAEVARDEYTSGMLSTKPEEQAASHQALGRAHALLKAAELLERFLQEVRGAR